MKWIATKAIISEYFKLNGEPFIPTDGQAEIFSAIVDDRITRLAIKAVTQYGKSEIAATALLWLCASTTKKILVIAPRSAQAKIIMDKSIGHIFDNILFENLIEFEGSVDRFKRERSKTRIDFKTGARLMILTADVRTISQEARSLMGFGADIVLVDESSLIPDEMFSKILRMVGGVENGKLIQLGNPFEKNHFWKAFQGDRYTKINIDYHRAIEEGRFTKEFIEEAREEMDEIDFMIFYENKFPDSASDGLIPYNKIEEAITRTINNPTGKKHLGGDVARKGSDKNVSIIRQGYKVLDMQDWKGVDLVQTRLKFQDLIDENNVEKVKIDSIGLGAGTVDEMNHSGYDQYGYYNQEEENYTVGVNVAQKASNAEYANIRAEMYWNLRSLFMNDLIDIPDDAELKKELIELKTERNSRGQKIMESKERMSKRGLRSPNKADALALAFYQPPEEEEMDFVIL